VLDQIVRQCIDKGVVKGNRQIIDSTHIRANISVSSIAGLVRKCRDFEKIRSAGVRNHCPDKLFSAVSI
ncbi:MAG: hypothetical protein HYX84_08315, partial [Chloroflexi bacterium]|nr:hypothetical protein [Chloroflexota bacterium]